MSVRAVLLLSCADQKGLVATVADWIYRLGGNIVEADQHSDLEMGVFLQRVEWDLDGFRLGREEIGAAFRPMAERFGMRWDLRFTDQVARMAILVSKLGHCLYDLLWRQKAGEFRAEVPLVVSNHEDLLRKGRDLEKVVLARAVDLHLRHGVLVYGNKTVVFD